MYDFELEKEDGGKGNKMILYSWSPNQIDVSTKARFDSSTNALKSALGGSLIEFKATHLSDISCARVRQQVSQGVQICVRPKFAFKSAGLLRN